MAEKIVFDIKSQHAMFSLLRFINHSGYYYKGNQENIKQTIIDFREYVKENEIESKSIVKCNCTCDITIQESVFNVCHHCEGMPYEPFLINE